MNINMVVPLVCVYFIGYASASLSHHHHHHDGSHDKSSGSRSRSPSRSNKELSSHTSWDSEAILGRLTCLERDVKELDTCKERLSVLEARIDALEDTINGTPEPPGIFTITVKLFSGLRDKSWIVPLGHPDHDQIVRALQAYTSREPPSHLGYRGFTISQPHCESCRDVIVASNTDQALELLLLSTARGVEGRILDVITDAINNPPPVIPPDPWVALPPWLTGTKYEPDVWNENDITQINNNCYNYGNNIITNTYAQPGRGSGDKYDDLTGPAVMAAAIADGLEFVDDGTTDLDNVPNLVTGNLVALVIAPNWDYHWYRRDYTGLWSHKAGSTEATDLDQIGNQIHDPRYAARGFYSEFTAFLKTTPQLVTIF